MAKQNQLQSIKTHKKIKKKSFSFVVCAFRIKAAKYALIANKRRKGRLNAAQTAKLVQISDFADKVAERDESDRDKLNCLYMALKSEKPKEIAKEE